MSKNLEGTNAGARAAASNVGEVRQGVILSVAMDLLFLSATTLIAGSAANAQASTSAKIPLRQLPAATAATTDTITAVSSVRQLPNGNVLINDPSRLRVSMFDKDMKFVSVVADSTSSTANAYGVRPGGLIAYRGDSTLFVDPASLSMLVIDPQGKIIRTMAAPRPNDVNFLIGGALGYPGFDAQGRLVYRTIDFGTRNMRMPGPGQPFVMPTPPDSSALVRFDLGTRKLDTVGFFKIPKANVSMSTDANGRMSMSVTMNPLPVVDEWAVMSNGTVAFVRGHDYHVDYIDASGTKVSSDKIPYDWQRMTDDDKSRFLDSAKVAIEKQRAAMAAGGAPGGGGQRIDIAGAASSMLGGGGGGGGAPMIFTMGGPGGPGGAAPPMRQAPSATPGGAGGPPGGPGGMTVQPVSMVPISELPDYKPVFGSGGVRADMDGRLWVRTIPTKVTTGGAIYEVLDGSGKLVDRVQVPANSTIAGFGAGNVVYLGVRDASGLHIQRVPMK